MAEYNSNPNVGEIHTADNGSLFEWTGIGWKNVTSKARPISTAVTQNATDIADLEASSSIKIVEDTTGTTLTNNQSNNYRRLTSASNQDYTLTATTLELNEVMMITSLSVGLSTLLDGGTVTINDPKLKNGISVTLSIIKVGATVYDII